MEQGSTFLIHLDLCVAGNANMPTGIWLTMWRWILLMLEASLKPRDIPSSPLDVVTSRSADARWYWQRQSCQADNDKPFVIHTLIHLKGGGGRIAFCATAIMPRHSRAQSLDLVTKLP